MRADTASDIVISARNVTLSFGRGAARTDVLRGIDLDVARGESIAILGPSGSGKSSLMAVLSGLEQASSGSVSVAGIDLGELDEDALARARRGNIGIVLQSFHLLPTMTALENVAVPLELSGADDAFATARSELGEVRLGHRLDHYPAQLSGGEQQRVAIARAVAPRPQILFADEPTGNLDGETGSAIIELLFDRQKASGATLIIITHDPLAGRALRPDPGGPGRPYRRGPPRVSRSWRFAARLAFRDVSRSLRGLRLLFLCIFLGVATIAAIGSLTAAITGELKERGQLILGGDVQVSMNQRSANEAEAAAMRSAGTVSETIRMRAMARRPDTGAAVLSELKGFDSAYPLYGSLLVSGRPAPELGPTDILIAPELGERLQVGPGDWLRFGDADFRIAGIISDEPDRVSEGFTLGPPVLVTMEGLERTGLVQPGSLFTTKYRLRLSPGTSPEQVIERLRSDLPDSSWEFRDRGRAAPGASRFFDRMGQFLTLVGLARQW